MTDTRTGPAAQKLVDAVREDLEEIVQLLDRTLGRMRALEVAGKGINGLSATMKAKANEVELTMEVLRSESESIARKMLADVKRPVTVEVRPEQPTRDLKVEP